MNSGFDIFILVVLGIPILIFGVLPVLMMTYAWIAAACILSKEVAKEVRKGDGVGNENSWAFAIGAAIVVFLFICWLSAQQPGGYFQM
jgi:hypothetical protein